MKKNKLKDSFFAELAKVPIVQVACEKTGISRNSVYRWRKEDKSFAQEMEKAMAEGVSFVNDMSESQLLTMIKDKDYRAISFWLRHRNNNYRNKLEITTEELEEMTPEEAKTVREALRLSATIISVNQKEHELPKDNNSGINGADDKKQEN